MTQQLDNYCVKLAADAIREYQQCITPVLYLFGLEEAGVYTELQLARDRQQYFQLVIPTHVPRDRDAFALTRWFSERLRYEPVLSVIQDYSNSSGA